MNRLASVAGKQDDSGVHHATAANGNRQERVALAAQAVALVAHAYGLTRAQNEMVLGSFRLLTRMNHQKLGRYKFREDCLAAYARFG
jgi:hypothetical protein